MKQVFRQVKYVIHPSFKHLAGYIMELPDLFASNKGKVIYKGRNELRVFDVNGQKIVVKSFCLPNVVNKIAYGLLRSSKAQRSYEYACLLQEKGIGTPQPVGYYTERNGLLFGRSYYASLLSACPYTYADFVKGNIPVSENVLRAIGRVTGVLHENGFLHKDYSRGNILFSEADDGKVQVEIIDLNRIRFCKVNMFLGCKNFERLPATPQMCQWMAEEYAKIRGFDVMECLRLINMAVRRVSVSDIRNMIQ